MSRFSLAQPRVEMRSTHSWAPGWLVLIAPRMPPSGTSRAEENMHRGLDGPDATSAAVHRAAAHGGAAGNTA